jgi:protein phosphatase
MAVEALARAPVATGGVAAVNEAIHEANRAVLERGDAEAELHGMGTTVTALFVDLATDRGHVAHVGDSRAYLLRAGALQQLTEDHTVVQELVRLGRLSPQDAERHPQRSIITRALGVDDDVDVDELTLALHEGDRFILCSDGLTLMLSEDGIALVLGTTPDPQDAADRLVALANEAGGDDNITVVVVDVLADPLRAAAEPMSQYAAADDPTQTASMPPIAIDAAPPATGADTPADRAPRRKRRRRGRMVAVLLIALLGVGVAGGFIGARAFLDGQWYVGASGDRVAVYQGIPASVLGVHLARVISVTPLSASEATKLVGWQTLPDGITAQSRSDADQIVERIRADLCRSTASTCVPGPAT